MQYTAYVCITLPIISVVLFSWMPESPYHYLKKGKEENARASLQWLLRKSDIESDFQQLKKDVQRQMSETGKWVDLLKIKSNSKALTACIFMRAGQQLSGIAVFETYIQVIFEKSGTALSPQVSSIIFSFLIWLVTSIFSITTDKLGRRKSFMYSSLSCALILLAESIFYYIDEFHKDIDLSNLQWLPLVALVFYIFFYSGGLSILPSLMATELFSASIKAKALSVTSCCLGIVVTIATMIFKFLSSSLGLYAPFLVFSICTFISFIFSYYIVPETRGKTLEEIQQDLKLDKNERGNKSNHF